MNYYFYIIHCFQPNTVSLQIPVFIEAPNIMDATSISIVLKTDIEKQFTLLFEPSFPVLYVPSINGPYINYFFSNLTGGNQVDINLPTNFTGNLFQFNTSGNRLQTIKALSTINGNHSNVYSL